MVKPIGYFKIWRELITKPIWLNSTPEQKTILITLLSMANFDAREWEWKGEKFKVGKGQFITSASSIIENCGEGITRQNVRTALKRFEKLEFLTYESTKRGMLINIVNWQVYQGNGDVPNQVPNQDLTKSQPRPNQELTTREEVENSKNEKNDNLYAEIINYLNQKAGKNFSHKTDATIKLINGRLADGRTLEDFKKVIDVKCIDWKGKFDKDGKSLENYLRPKTLFTPSNFENYLNESSANKTQTSGRTIADF